MACDVALQKYLLVRSSRFRSNARAARDDFLTSAVLKRFPFFRLSPTGDTPSSQLCKEEEGRPQALPPHSLL